MKVEKLSANCKNTEANAGAGRMGKAFTKSTLANNPQMGGLFALINQKNAELTLAIKRKKAQSELKVKDEVRDAAIRALFGFVEGSCNHPQKAVANGANTLLTRLKHYGRSITVASYDSESSLVGSLLADMEENDMQAAIAAVPGVAELLAEVQLAESEFETSHLNFQESQSKDKKKQNATTLKAELLVLVNDNLITYLNGMLVAAPATYADFAAVIKQIIDTMNENVHKRGTSGPKDDDDNDDDADSDDPETTDDDNGPDTI